MGCDEDEVMGLFAPQRQLNQAEVELLCQPSPSSSIH
jgi:hypothetical protein